jgi:hypothetical protein
MVMQILKLAFTDESVEFFSNLYFSEDHNSSNRTAMGLFKILTLWCTGHYHVYVPVDENNVPFAICHGQLTCGDFHGHLYFLKEWRGPKAYKAFIEVVRLIEINLDPKRIVAKINEDNAPAKMFVSQMGFKRVDDYYIFNLKESA